ncbi:hypothetical protein L615_002000000500 [Nocardioides sp. J9]|uniref:hypothetical protein n=1 Tax=unclassified Nocardioides TaxID=2615069 RepID=UPI0004AD4CD1|nr:MULTISPECIES: hypothetical protein [unclassified Nocardioides]TWH00727.1 hypothetical protein L615_002000000500 [Nocardioides sp. J9]
MRFTEHELTAALNGVAKQLLASDRKLRRKGVDPETAWAEMDRYQRFRMLDALGDQVLPVLVALPDVDVAPGTRPTYDDKVVSEVVSGLLGEGRGRVRRAAEVKARTALVQLALASIPPRLDPDALLTGES